jgi:hypothetical protein
MAALRLCFFRLAFVMFLSGTGIWIAVPLYSGKPTSFDPLPPRRFKFKNEWGIGVGIAGIYMHIPANKLTSDKLISAIQLSQTNEIKDNVLSVGQAIRNGKGA